MSISLLHPVDSFPKRKPFFKKMIYPSFAVFLIYIELGTYLYPCPVCLIKIIYALISVLPFFT